MAVAATCATDRRAPQSYAPALSSQTGTGAAGALGSVGLRPCWVTLGRVRTDCHPVPRMIEPAYPGLHRVLQGIPTLALDVEYGSSGSGQVATRVQAFLEMLEAGRK